MKTLLRLGHFVFPALLGIVGCGGGDAEGPPVAEAHLDAHGVGSVTFPVSCSEEARVLFEPAVAMLHSFWFDEADAAFRAVAEADPACAMARWGRAMTLWGNPMTRAAPPDTRVADAVAAIGEARSLAGSASERERMYIEAAAALYEGHPQVGHLERMRAHEAGMKALMDAHPEDPEAAIFYGRIVIANAPPDDLSFARQLHAVTVMEPLLADRPDHPGLAHYLIHAYDAPPIAEEGLAAALRYADIAPDAPHALHMPSHIFTRLGYWEESIELNTRSAAAEPNPDAAVHPLDYMVYAYLQLGRDAEAGEVVTRARNIPDEFYGGLIGYNFAAMPARYALERNRWEEAMDTPVPQAALPYVEAVARFARALGAARFDRADMAGPEIERLGELAAELRDGGDGYWATVVESQRLAAAAWVAHAAGEDAEALRLAREAAELEGTVEKHPVTPGPLLPALELLGDLLMEMDRPGEALGAYEAVLESERNRARATFGAARAAERAGNTEAAERHFRALGELLAEADTDRPELQALAGWQARNP